MVEIKGIIAPIITPMNEDESVNFDEFRNQIARLISNGIMEYLYLGQMEKATFCQRMKS